jgi:hypothetical protein
VSMLVMQLRPPPAWWCPATPARCPTSLPSSDGFRLGSGRSLYKKATICFTCRSIGDEAVEDAVC